MSLDDGLLKLTGKLKTPPSTIVASPMVTTGAASSTGKWFQWHLSFH